MKPGKISASEVLQIPGGTEIERARERARGLLRRSKSSAREAPGSLEGWEDLQHRGELDRLLISEHLHDRDEFLRRHVDREQLYIARQSTRDESGGGHVLWDASVSFLGAMRRHAWGAILSILDDSALTARTTRLHLGQRELVEPIDGAMILSSLRVDPESDLSEQGPAEGSQKRWLLDHCTPTRDSVFWILDARDDDCLHRLQIDGLVFPETRAFLLDGRSIELWKYSPQRGGGWRREGEARRLRGFRHLSPARRGG